jgi:hypothetical protein
LPGGFLADRLRHCGHIVRQFQIAQEGPESLELRLVKGPRFSDGSSQKLVDAFRNHLGDDMSVNVEFVEAFDPDSAYCLSNVDALATMGRSEP